MQLIILGLALVNLLWGASALVDPSNAREPTLPHPLLLFAAHTLSGSAMFFQKLRPYALLSTATLTAFYVLRVKPFEPLAEPQTVGILGITLSQLLPHILKAVHQPKLDNFVEDFLLRAGIAYPLFEWGLDAYRNPLHFISYIRGNILARAVAAPLGIENTVFLIFVVEVSLSLLLVSGLGRKAVGLSTAALLTLFSVVAAYPLALPQNIALIAAAITYARTTTQFIRLNLKSV